MNNIDYVKIIRGFIISMVFLPLFYIGGLELREAQQFFFMLWIMCITALLMRNIWLTLFIWWTVFLYTYYKFQFGNVYLFNVFYGSILYFLTKVSFRKKHIQTFINAYYWLLFLNILYLIVQITGYDFLYNTKMANHFTGFMGARCILGVVFALAIPLVMAKQTKSSIVLAFLMIIPICVSASATNIFAAGCGVLFILWFRMPRKTWFLLVLLVGAIIGNYIYHIDAPQFARFELWKIALKQVSQHPVIGLGLDSFRNITPTSPLFVSNTNRPWDNPHNLYVSLFYEWGIVAIILLIGYLRQMGEKFKRAVKDPLVLSLTGFMIVFFIVCMAHFPMFLARCTCFLIPMFALWEISMD